MVLQEDNLWKFFGQAGRIATVKIMPRKPNKPNCLVSHPHPHLSLPPSLSRHANAKQPFLSSSAVRELMVCAAHRVAQAFVNFADGTLKKKCLEMCMVARANPPPLPALLTVTCMERNKGGTPCHRHAVRVQG